MEDPQLLRKRLWRSTAAAALIGGLVAGGGTGVICRIDALFPDLRLGLIVWPTMSLPAVGVAHITGLNKTAPVFAYGNSFITLTNAVVGGILGALVFIIRNFFKANGELLEREYDMENPQPVKKSFWASPAGAALIGALVAGGGTTIVCIVDTLFPKLMVGPSLMIITLPAVAVARITGLDQTAPEFAYGNLFITVTNAVLGAALAGLFFMTKNLFKSKT
jgi:hypothetical protein